jgi:capsid portal protein
MFMGYDEANRTKSRSSFRLPPIFVGQSDDYTRATADASAHMAEEQVFRPERVDFDYRLNRWLMPEIESSLHDFVSNGPNVTMNEDLIAALVSGESAGAMTPNIGRTILSDVLERAVPQITEPWGDQPFALVLEQARAATAQASGFGGGAQGADGQPPASGEPTPKSDAASKLYAELARKMSPALKAAVIREVRSVVQRELKRKKG